ncbi:MAG: cytochrome-c oxidase [Betaproteobacteria bacterium HGW-Betaproteobacteria-12]|nr:MAG: cytochrome-c oxidase [Betaproteobacteria bacterium HGW-Betaproteobacteria-12]
MADSNSLPALATEPADVTETPEARVPGVLVFILADMIVFAMLFTGFMVERSGQLALFDQSSASLDVWLGILNTLILITSGLFVVFAVNAARQGRTRATRGWLLATFVVGAGFGVTKMVEYSAKIGHGITMHTNDFYMFYYALTGAHFLHFLGGMLALAVLWFMAGRQKVDGPLFGLIESGALYWHMVDLLWIVIFPLLYLLGTR